jgi:hypothetical protein
MSIKFDPSGYTLRVVERISFCSNITYRLCSIHRTEHEIRGSLISEKRSLICSCGAPEVIKMWMLLTVTTNYVKALFLFLFLIIIKNTY